jgi:hypothetical protein
MKTFLLFTLLAIIAGGCKSKNSKTAEQTLREFYAQYITACDEMSDNTAIKENFLTKELITKLAEADLEYDPFLNAQDCDKAWVETLEINPVSGQGMDGAYRICYDGGDVICLTLFLVQREGKWQINDIEELSEIAHISTDEDHLATAEDIICDAYQEDDGYTTVEECTYLNKNMQQVYEIIKQEDPHLKPELPVADLQYGELDREGVEITYTYKEPKYLQIELFYNGGVTTIELIENESGTSSKIIRSAD